MSTLAGVYATTKKDGSPSFRASLTFQSKHISLGSYSDEKKAALAYQTGRHILENPAIRIADYHLCTELSHDKFICLLNARDNGIYIPTPIYLYKQYFEYYLSSSEILRFDRDDLFFYASHKIQKKGGYLFVSDYGSQYSILSRYGIKPFAVYGRDYCMVNGDPHDYRYSNIKIINSYFGVQQEVLPNGKTVYRTKIHINGDFLVGVYEDEITAAIAYNKAADTLQKNGFHKAFMKNYIVSLNKHQYESVYQSVAISDAITNFVPDPQVHHSFPPY